MKQSLIWVGIGAIVIIGGAYFLSIGKDDVMMEEDSSAMMEETKAQDEEVMMEKGDGMEAEGDAMMKKGSYEPYSVGKLAYADGGDVVLFFRASWCPTCKAGSRRRPT